jgi:hypothetical protein
LHVLSSFFLSKFQWNDMDISTDSYETTTFILFSC